MFSHRAKQQRWALRGLFWVVLTAALARAIWPDPFTEPYIGPWDKVVHGGGSFVLVLLAGVAYPRVRLPLLGLGILAFGGMVEVLQSLPFIHRDASWGDLAADFTGICAALIPTLLPALREGLRRR